MHLNTKKKKKKKKNEKWKEKKKSVHITKHIKYKGGK